MDKVQEELEEAKAEIEKLKCNLDYKECIIKQLSSTNDSQRAHHTEKLSKLEEENKQLLGNIDEANEEGRQMEMKLKALEEEAQKLKAVVSVLENKCSEAKKGPQSPKEGMLIGGDLVQQLEEKTRKLEDELKWKVEQFKHLEEAHEKLRHQLSSSRSDWEAERLSLVDQLSRLQAGFDDGQRSAETGEEEVSDLRHTLRVKEMECKDAQYKLKKLEKENQEILASLKDLQEAQIPRAVPTPSSWAKLRGKLKSLEQTHRECAANLKAKEAEWRSQSDKLSSRLQIKDQAIDNLKRELNDCSSNLTQLKMQNEELSLMLQLLRSECSEGEDKEGGLVHLMGQLEKEREEKGSMRQELEEASERERKLRDELEQVYEALDTIDSELTDITNHGSEQEFELENWMSIAERLKMQLEESQQLRRELEASLIAQAEVEEMFNRETEEKDRRISNLEQQILLMDQEIRIGEDDEVVEYDDGTEDEEALQRFEEDKDDDRLHLDLLARELEVAILAHITEERAHMHQQSLQEDRYTKENENQQNCIMNKTVEPIIDDRPPFKVLN